jgi:hypothetical protein
MTSRGWCYSLQRAPGKGNAEPLRLLDEALWHGWRFPPCSAPTIRSTTSTRRRALPSKCSMPTARWRPSEGAAPVGFGGRADAAVRQMARLPGRPYELLSVSARLGDQFGGHAQPLPNFVNYINIITLYHGGRGGIRTHGTLAGTPVFKTGRLNHSRTLPSLEIAYDFCCAARTEHFIANALLTFDQAMPPPRLAYSSACGCRYPS